MSGANQSLFLYQIVGAPMLALVQGQAQAAQTTAEFIETVGFKKDPTNTDPDSLGDLRMLTFQYSSPDTDGTTQLRTISVPLLSIVPIPTLEIQEAEIDFSVKVADTYTSDITNTVSNTESTTTAQFLSNKRTQLRGGVSNRNKSTQQQQNTAQIDMKVKLGQADITTGLEFLFATFDQAITQESQTQ